jgi:hypothetical protein
MERYADIEAKSVVNFSDIMMKICFKLSVVDQ